ncbi:uncharacterized protein EI90DRAFT_3125459 [Cantharellus anzutake]|uniref:uncharacterized protein n=1 Tax=Cantharellus anzutake TaxID=1750568 RepID=UPI0019031A2D|nr:uncharacterized protein EI90DRAFT_3125459 [Cantharellus anzutake]KAF8329128.1 hypothetical protein EI90DRAFT_3125459 [Cantharellus anzutake]
MLDVGEADAAPIDPDPIRSPNAPPDELDSLGVVADTEAPAAIAANLDNVPIDTETQSVARGTSPSAPVPLLPTTSEDMLWREFIQTLVSFKKGLESRFSTILERLDTLEGHQELRPEEVPRPVEPDELEETLKVPEGPLEPASTVPRQILDPARASKQALHDQGTFPMVTTTQNLHDNNDLPKFIHVPGSGDPGIQMATILPDLESEESTSSPVRIPSHLKEKWVNKDCNKPDHFLEPRNRPPDDEANRSEGLQKTIMSYPSPAIDFRSLRSLQSNSAPSSLTSELPYSAILLVPLDGHHPLISIYYLRLPKYGAPKTSGQLQRPLVHSRLRWAIVRD